MKKKYILLFVFLCCMVLTSEAQCAMCRAVLESEGNVAQARGVNNGIIFLMAVPYLLVAITGFYIYRIFNKKSAVKKS
jgi:heme/copper-type cytochrome/quinol oxidase subunit 2